MPWDDRIGRRLKLRDLHILLAVIERGSMAKAASDLAMSQPAVSKAIADMEHTLGLRLLDRNPRGVEVTAYGRVLGKRGLAVFDELRQGVRELEFLADPTSGELRIGASEAMAAGLLPAILDRMSRRYPRITIKASQAFFATLQYRELRERAVDLLLGRIPAPIEEDDLTVETLFEDRVTIVAEKRSPLFRRRRLKLADLRGERWLLQPSDSPPGHLAAQIFGSAGLDVPEPSVSTLSIHLALRLVATGRFIATLPSSVLRFGPKDLPLKALSFTLPVQPSAVGIITLKDRTPNPVAEVFANCAREVLGNHQKKSLSPP
jgi:DNA-binding transcriptional LysR family regulator